MCSQQFIILSVHALYVYLTPIEVFEVLFLFQIFLFTLGLILETCLYPFYLY